MRISVKTIILALFMTVVIAQGGWSATLGEPYPVTGTVYMCEAGTSGIQIETDAGIVSVYGMGPVSYWGDLLFPEVGETISILVSEITYSDGTSKLVAMSVDVNDDGTYDIDLRDIDGVPLWRESKAASVQYRGKR
jgi:hypothetical protein